MVLPAVGRHHTRTASLAKPIKLETFDAQKAHQQSWKLLPLPTTETKTSYSFAVAERDMLPTTGNHRKKENNDYYATYLLEYEDWQTLIILLSCALLQRDRDCLAEVSRTPTRNPKPYTRKACSCCIPKTEAEPQRARSACSRATAEAGLGATEAVVLEPPRLLGGSVMSFRV